MDVDEMYVWDLYRRLNLIACEIVGHNKEACNYTSRTKKITFYWSQCNRCSRVLAGKAPNFDLQLVDAYDPKLIAESLDNTSPFWSALYGK